MKYTLEDVIDGKVAIENNMGYEDTTVKVVNSCFPVSFCSCLGNKRYYLLDEKSASWKATDDQPLIATQNILDFKIPTDLTEIKNYAHGMYMQREADLKEQLKARIAKRTAARSKGKPVVDVKLEGNSLHITHTIEKEPDLVNHPSHYTSGKIEVIDFIEDQKLGMHLGNSVKYIARAGKKDPSKTVQDLEKAIWYIKRFIAKYEKAD